MSNAALNAWRLLLATWAINSLLSPHQNHLLPLRPHWVVPPCSSGVAAEVHLFALQRVVPIARPKIGCHFQGTSHRPPNPGLKPWSFLYSHSAAKSDKPVRTESKNDFALMGRS